MPAYNDPMSQRFYHGTKADLSPGDLIVPGYNSNYGSRKKAAYVYLSATLDAAIWGQSWPSARGRAGSTSWNRPAPSRMIRTSRTRGFRGIPRNRTAVATRFGSRARSPPGRGTLPKNSKRCRMASSGSGFSVSRPSKNEPTPTGGEAPGARCYGSPMRSSSARMRGSARYGASSGSTPRSGVPGSLSATARSSSAKTRSASPSGARAEASR